MFIKKNTFLFSIYCFLSLFVVSAFSSTKPFSVDSGNYEGYPIEEVSKNNPNTIYAFSFDHNDSLPPEIYRIEKVFKTKNDLEFYVSQFTKKDQEELPFNLKCFPVSNSQVFALPIINNYNAVIIKLGDYIEEHPFATFSDESVTFTPVLWSPDKPVSTPPVPWPFSFSPMFLSSYTTQDIKPLEDNQVVEITPEEWIMIKDSFKETSCSYN